MRDTRTLEAGRGIKKGNLRLFNSLSVLLDNNARAGAGVITPGSIGWLDRLVAECF